MKSPVPSGPECPGCEYGRMVWNPPVWTCGCGHEQDLVHWLEPGATRRLHIQPESFGDNPEYEIELDSQTGKHWLRRVVSGRSAVRRSRRPGIYQVAFTNDQYDLIAWCVYMHEEHGWTVLEIFRIIDRFWVAQPGQTPLVSRMIHAWLMNRRKMAKRGLEWP